MYNMKKFLLGLSVLSTLSFCVKASDFEIVGEDWINLPVSMDDALVNYDLTKVATAFGLESVSALFEGYYVKGLKADGTYTEGLDAINSGIIFTTSGAADTYGDIGIGFSEDYTQIWTYSNVDLGVPFKAEATLCFEIDNRRYVIYMTLLDCDSYGTYSDRFVWRTAQWNIKDSMVYNNINEFDAARFSIIFPNPTGYNMTNYHAIYVGYDIYVDDATEPIKASSSAQAGTSVMIDYRFPEGHTYRIVTTKTMLICANLHTYTTDTLSVNYDSYSITFTINGPELQKTIDVEAHMSLAITNQEYTKTVSKVDAADICATLGISDISEAVMHPLSPNGSYCDHMDYFDWWRDADGEFTNCNGGYNSIFRHDAYPAVYCIKINDSADSVTYYFYDYWKEHVPEEGGEAGGSMVSRAPQTSYNSVIWDWINEDGSVTQYKRSYRVDEGKDYQSNVMYVANGKSVIVRATMHFIPLPVKLNLMLPFSFDIYENLYIELVDNLNKTSFKRVITESSSYSFFNLQSNREYSAYVKNKSGNILGSIINFYLDGDATVTFDYLLQPQSLKIAMYTPDGIDVTESTTVTWYDADGNYLCKDTVLSGQVENTEVKYSVKLSKELALQYNQPEQATYMVKPSGNEIKVILEPFALMEVTGTVRDSVTGTPISDAMVTFSQKLNGEYAHITRAETDSKGAFKANIYDVPTEVTVAAADYISYTLSLDTLTEIAAIGEILMKSISGVVVSTGFTYRTSVSDGDTPDILDWYSDYANVKYGIMNKTTGLPVSNFSVQYPQIVLLDDVAVGDELLLTVVSRTNSFEPTQTTAVVDSALQCDATFDIVELGGIEASYTTTTNSAVVGILYNEIGEMVQKRSYSSGSLTLDNLRDGSYTLVTMGSSDYFNAIYNMAQLSAVGLVEGADYVKHAVKVESGVVSVVEMESVPAFDESKLYYTGGDTRFTVNKTSATAGNYLTLTGKIDFKEEYASKVSGVSMVIDIPESAVFVDNSVMVGAAIAPYTLEGNRLTISLPGNYTERVRFCIIPTESGSYAPTAFAQFTIDGKEVLQPIGSAHYTIKDLSIEVPSISGKTIAVSGMAIGQSTIQIYDDDVLIGETTSLANGVWNATCELHEPYNLSKHRIHAKVTTKLGVELTSETKECMYDMNYVQVSKVKMYHWNPEMGETYESVFDFMNPSSKPNKWTVYYPDKKFTYTVEFTNNSPEIVQNVILYVHTADGKVVPLYPEYNEEKDLWTADIDMGNRSDGYYPVNVSVDFDATVEPVFDATIIEDYNTELQEIISSSDNYESLIETLHASLIKELEKSPIDEGRVKEINDSIDALLGISKEELEEIEKEVEYLYTVWKNKTWVGDDGDDSEEKWCYYVSEYIDKICDYEEDFPDYPNPEEFIDKLVQGEPLPAESTMLVADDGNLRITYEKNAPSDNLSDYLKQDGIWEVQDNSDVNTSSVELINSVSKDRIILDASNRLEEPSLTTDGMRSFANSAIGVMNEYNNEVDFIAGISGDIYGDYAKYMDKNYILMQRMSTQAYGESSKRFFSALADDYLKRANMAKTLGNVANGISSFAGGWGIGTDINDGWSNAKDWDALIDRIGELCSESASADIIKRAEDYKGRYMRRYATKTFGGVGLTGVGIASASASGMTLGVSLLITAASYGISKGLDHWKECYTRDDNNRKSEIRGLVNSNPDCKPIDDDDNDGGDYNSGYPNDDVLIDPSGYVYEGVSSNRLGGVMASCYYKETVEDIYGDQHENVVLWDAEEYAQENPLFTDANGMYRWDVPKGLWQVKFEKEGYETTYSEWLPVPPPQLEVNIPMVQNKQPEVAGVHAYKDGVEIEFDKYMQPATLNTDNIFVIQNGEKVAGTVTLINEEVAYEGKSETYASKVRFVFDQAVTAKEITLTVVNSVKSYAGLQMQDTYTQTFAIEQEVEGIVADSLVSMYYGGEHTLTVKIIPAAAAAGKTLAVTSSSPMMLGVDTDSIVLDDSGEAVLTVSGELPGMGAISYSLVGYDYRASTLVEVVYNNTKMTANPTASIASGTTVAKSTEVTLSCTTEGLLAKIVFARGMLGGV